MVFISLFRGKEERKTACKLLFANQNRWSNGCKNTKILTHMKNGVDKYKKKQAKHIYQTMLPTVFSLLFQRSKLPNIQTRENFQWL